nr:MAG TPA: hypothetical protein [Caudoviricetes sp.]
MKKLITIALAITLMLSVAIGLTGCGGKKAETKKKPYNLSGEWKQVNGDEDGWQQATVTDDTIEIYWMSDDTKALYWSGSYEKPTKYTKVYKWTSTANKEKHESALLASQDDTKEFSYDGKYITYKASAMGVEKKMKLEKVKK